MIVRNLTRGLALGDRIRRADTFRLRLLGLMFRPGLEPGEGLWLEPCCQVHTHFMRFPLDLLFLDAEGRVLPRAGVLSPVAHQSGRSRSPGRAGTAGRGDGGDPAGGPGEGFPIAGVLVARREYCYRQSPQEVCEWTGGDRAHSGPKPGCRGCPRFARSRGE